MDRQTHAHTRAHITYSVKCHVHVCQKRAHRSLSSEMNSTYGTLRTVNVFLENMAKAQCVRELSKKCTAIGGWRQCAGVLASTHTSCSICEKPCEFIQKSNQLLTANAFSQLTRAECLRALLLAFNEQTNRRHIDTCPTCTISSSTCDDIWK